jgi:hypothetical protein
MLEHVIPDDVEFVPAQADDTVPFCKIELPIVSEPGYHLVQIPKGEYGSVAKIEEELLELKDALAQGNKIMALIELSDMLGAIEGYIKKEYDDKITFDDLKKMADTTCRAFRSGCRQ